MGRYYTVDEIANMLSMHPKTIQRYIREDKLHAKKVGKSWRIYEQDLKVFMECSNITSDIMPQTSNKTVASSVVDINVTDSNEAFDIEKYLMASMNSRSGEVSNSAIHIQYLESENKLRVTLWGCVSFMKDIFGILSVVLKSDEMEK